MMPGNSWEPGWNDSAPFLAFSLLFGDVGSARSCFLPESPTREDLLRASVFADGAVAAVEQRLREIGVAAFKLGIAMSPIRRFKGLSWSYKYSEGFTEMMLLMASTATECRALETMLIARFRARPGCYNEKPGGEGIRDSELLCFTYAVFADAGTGRALGLPAREVPGHRTALRSRSPRSRRRHRRSGRHCRSHRAP